MSTKASWIAVKPDLISRAIKLMKLNEIEENESIETDISILKMESGWHVILLDFINDFTDNQDFLQDLSSGEVLIGSLHEGTMMNDLECWKNQKRVWRVFYNGEDSSGLATEGELPEEYEGVFKKFNRLEEIQYDVPDSKVDYLFSIPCGLFKVLTGFSLNVMDYSKVESEKMYSFDKL